MPMNGLSPRGRGNPDSAGRRAGRRRSIPAWAGKPARPEIDQPPIQVYPRVGGETNSAPTTLSTKTGLSPRGRGNLCVILTHSFAYVKDRWCY